MKFCFGTVCWNGYLERYINMFVDNYITLFRKLIGLGINYNDISDPKIIYNGETLGYVAEHAGLKLKFATGKKLVFVCDKHKYSIEQIMYSTRNKLRQEFKKTFPSDKKVFFYFPIDDNIRPEAAVELIKLSKQKVPTACMFRFFVNQGGNDFIAGTRAIRSYKDINSDDWGGYCAYTILDEETCPLYPKIAIPNVAFYAELYRAGYEEYESDKICVDHLRHSDSHHFKYKNTAMSQEVKDFLRAQRIDLYEKGYK